MLYAVSRGGIMILNLVGIGDFDATDMPILTFPASVPLGPLQGPDPEGLAALLLPLLIREEALLVDIPNKFL